MPTTYTKICIRQYCRYHTEWPKQAFIPAQFQGIQKGHMDASQDTVGVRHARNVAQDRQYLAVMVHGRRTGSKKGSGAAHQQELRLAEDQLGDAPVPPRGPRAREGAGTSPLQDFLPDASLYCC